jgi:hypothetical protein
MAQNKLISNIISLNFLKTFTNFLMGFLAGLIFFLIGLKIISSIFGAVIGLILSFCTASYLYKKYKNKKSLKNFSIGMFSASIVIILCYLGISALFWSLFTGIAG